MDEGDLFVNNMTPWRILYVYNGAY